MWVFWGGRKRKGTSSETEGGTSEGSWESSHGQKQHSVVPVQVPPEQLVEQAWDGAEDCPHSTRTH